MSNTAKRPGRPAKYDWDSLVDGSQHVLFQGSDFDSELPSFRALVHSTAHRRGKKVATSIDTRNKSVTFTFRDEE